MMFGIHFFTDISLKLSFCGFITTAFTSDVTSNTTHYEFLSVLQAPATLWAPCFDSEKVKAMTGDEPGKQAKHSITSPDTKTSNVRSLQNATRTRGT